LGLAAAEESDVTGFGKGCGFGSPTSGLGWLLLVLKLGVVVSLAMEVFVFKFTY
jgi:hypothetical protein